MNGIQFVTDAKGRRVAVPIRSSKAPCAWEELADGPISESRRKEKAIPYEQYRSGRLKRGRAHG